MTLAPEILEKIFIFAVDALCAKSCLNLALAGKTLRGVGIPVLWRTLDSFNPILHRREGDLDEWIGVVRGLDSFCLSAGSDLW